MEIKSIPLLNIQENTGQIPGLPKNPRIITKENYEKLIKSIQEDPEMLELKELWVYPFNGKYITIAGNMRRRALIQLQYKDAPCKIIPEKTTIEKLKRYAIKDNVEFGQHDWDLIANEWSDLPLEDWGLDIQQWENKENKEINSEELSKDLDTICPRCGFEFDKNV